MHNPPSTSPSNPFGSSSSVTRQQQQQQQQQQQTSQSQPIDSFTPTSLGLTTLAHDENTILHRRQNIARFGAGWIRPPGVAKTLQASMDEAAEREEMMRAEAEGDVEVMDVDGEGVGGVDIVGLEAERQQVEEGQGQVQEEVEQERDLDEEVPEAEEVDGDWGTDDEERDDDEEQDGPAGDESMGVGTSEIMDESEGPMESSPVEALRRRIDGR